jgi:hypothetical protein
MYFSKICRNNSSSVKIWQELRVLYMKTYVYLWQYLAEFFFEWEMPQTSYRKNQNTHFMFSNIFFFENRAVYEIMWKDRYIQTSHRLQHNTTHVLCTLDNQGYRHTTKMASRKRINVTFIGRLPVLLTFILMTFVPWKIIIKHVLQWLLILTVSVR